MKKIIVFCFVIFFSLSGMKDGEKALLHISHESFSFDEFVPYLKKIQKTNALENSDFALIRPHEILCFDILLEDQSPLWKDLYDLSRGIEMDEPFETCKELLGSYCQNTFAQLKVFSHAIEQLTNSEQKTEFSEIIEQKLDEKEKLFFHNEINKDFSTLHEHYIAWRSLRATVLGLLSKKTSKKEPACILPCFTMCMGEDPFNKELKQAAQSIVFNGHPVSLLVMNK